MRINLLFNILSCHDTLLLKIAKFLYRNANSHRIVNKIF